MTRHAEIIGAGIAGLTAAAALGKRGWSVRVHEKAEDLRLVGAGGLSMFENALRVLEAIDAYEDTVAGANPFIGIQTRDEKDRITSQQRCNVGRRVYEMSRTQLMNAIYKAAVRAGAEVLSGSEAVGVDPSGVVRFVDGKTAKADLVVVADGINSPNRDSLGLRVKRTPLKDGAIRIIVPRVPQDAIDIDRNMSIEWWVGIRRILAVALSETELYLALTTLDTDTEYKALPLNKKLWKSQFPFLSSALDRVTTQGRWDRFETIKMDRWSKGKVAIIGDAAHAMAPNLGQGGACAMMNAIGLAHSLDQYPNMSEALDAWEREQRPLIDHTQKWSTIYSSVTTWPAQARSMAFAAARQVPWIQKIAFKAVDHNPIGCAI